MPTYVFRCPACGPFDRRAPIRDVPDEAACPTCGEGAPRGVTSPALNGGDHRVAAAHERSAHAPGVVGSVPAGPTPGAPPAARRVAPDPRHVRLPRP